MSSAGRSIPIFEGMAITALALVVRSFHGDHAPLYDELYHFLAARSWIANGSLAIGDGEYTRAAEFTTLIGWMLERFGETLAIARIVPMVSDSLLVLSLYLWTRSVAGRGAGFTAALLLCFSPNAIVLSQFIRPYTMHALLFFWGAIALYASVSAKERSGHYGAGSLCAGAAMLALALRLQITTLIGLVGISFWLLLTQGPAWWQGFRRKRSYRTMVMIGIGMLVMAVAGVVVLIESGIAAHLLALARERPLWAQGSKFYVYHGIFMKYYPTFWGLLPVACLYAIAKKGRPALFCVGVFTVSLFLHLFFPIRGQRYISYLMPFFFALWGMVLADVLTRIDGLALAAAERALPLWRSPERTGKILRGLAVAVTLLFLLGGNSAFYHAGKIMVKGPIDVHPQYGVDWAAARGILEPLAQTADIVVTTNALSALYHLNRSDIEFSATHLYETRGREEFSVDHRTGRPVISETESLRRLMACYPKGLVIAELWQWKNRIVGIDPGSADLLDRIAERVDLPSTSKLLAFTWRNRDGDRREVTGMTEEACGSVREQVGNRR